MSFQFWDLLQDTPLCEGAVLGRDREGDALSNVHPLQHTSLKKERKKKSHLLCFLALKRKLSLLGPDIPHGSDPSTLLPEIWTSAAVEE